MVKKAFVKEETLNRKSKVLLLSILATLMALTSLSTDIYLPAMPQMQKEFGGNIELTITGFLVGFAIAQIIWGPISDRIGRKRPMIIGLFVFTVGSAGCAMSNNLNQIIFWRVVQAFGGCTGPMLSRTMVRDMFSRTRAAEMLSTLMVVMAIAPILGPVIGGQILKFSNWNSIFWLLTVIGIIVTVLVFFILPETHPVEKRTNTSVGMAFSNYSKLLRNGIFMRYTLCVTFFYVGAYAFIAGSPFVYITYYHIPTEYYGWLFALNIIGLMVVSYCNRLWVKRFSLDKLLRISTIVAMIAGITLVIFSKWNIWGVYGIIVPVFFFYSMNGIIAATSTAAALDGVPEMAGAASALLGSLQYGSGILSTLLLAWFIDGTPWTICWIIGLFGFAAAVMVLYPQRKTL